MKKIKHKDLQYITDAKGHKSVQLPMKEWERIQKDLGELERLRNKKLFMTELSEAVEEMKLIKEGKNKPVTLKISSMSFNFKTIKALHLVIAAISSCKKRYLTIAETKTMLYSFSFLQRTKQPYLLNALTLNHMSHKRRMPGLENKVYVFRWSFFSRFDDMMI